MMKRLLLVLLLAVPACAHGSALQRAQQSHDFLALAGDTEANLCWGVASVPAAIAANVPPTHCTAPIATVIGLTDARHQSFNGGMKKALDLHKAAVTLLASGAVADLTAVNTAIQDLLAIIAELQSTNPGVASIQLHLNQARLK